MDESLALQMREEWNARAREDAKYFVAFGRWNQDEDEFFASGGDVVRELAGQFLRLPGRRCRRALEIGCGLGRLMRPMAGLVGEIHGVDVSDEMIRGARERLRGIANAHVHVGGGADLAGFDDGAFDLVYSYAVFQHIPSREAIFGYLAEAGRVLAPGGVLWFQANGAAGGGDVADTWHGARLAAGEAAAFAREAGLRLMAVEGPDTPYMAVTIQKPARGGARAAGPARIVRVAGGHHPGLAAPARGRRAFASLWIEGLPEGSDLNTLEATVQGARATGEWLGPFLGPPETDGIWQFRVRLPELEAGLDTVELLYRGARIAPAALLRTIPAGPAVPRLVALSDAAELLSTQRIASGAVRASFEEAPDAAGFRAQVDGRAITDCEARCVDPVAPRIEVTFRLPEGTGPGPHRLEMALGGRRFAALTIEVV